MRSLAQGRNSPQLRPGSVSRPVATFTRMIGAAILLKHPRIFDRHVLCISAPDIYAICCLSQRFTHFHILDFYLIVSRVYPIRNLARARRSIFLIWLFLLRIAQSLGTMFLVNWGPAMAARLRGSLLVLKEASICFRRAE